MDAQVRGGDGHRVDAHLAGADLVVVGDQVAHAVLDELLVGADVGAGGDLAGAPVLEGAGLADLAREPEAGEQRPHVGGLRQVLGIQRRVVGRVGRAEPETAPAERADEAGHDRVAVAVGGLRVALDRHREVRHERLQVGGGHPRVAGGEQVRLEVVGLALRDRLRRLVQHRRQRVVVQVGADAGQVGPHLEAERAQVVGRADAGQQQQLGRADHAAADDHVPRAAQLGGRPRGQGRVGRRVSRVRSICVDGGRGGTGGRRPLDLRRRRPGF